MPTHIFPREHATLCKYACWFAPRARLGRNPYTALQPGRSRVVKVIIFGWAATGS